MTTPYTYSVMKIAVAQICQKIGWHAVHQSSLELMVDILDKYMKGICKTTHDYVELYNRTEFNLDDLGLTFRDLGINISDIEEYVQYVDPIVPAIEVPKFPVKKDSHLNFLKPGSKEVLTRPVYIPEHLPPINPPEEEELLSIGITNDKDDVTSPGDDTANGVFKRPLDATHDGNSSKKPKMSFEDEVRPIREITSVIMTTSGFISPAREGKLPESKAPHIAPEYKPILPPPAPSVSTFIKQQQQNQNNQQLQNVASSSSEKKLEKKFKKKNHDKEKKKLKRVDAVKEEIASPFLLNPMAIVNQPSSIGLSVESPVKSNKKLSDKKQLKVPKKHKIKKNQPMPGELFQVLPKTKRDKLDKQRKQMLEIPNEFLPKIDLPLKNPPPQQPVQAHSFLTGSMSLSGALHESMHSFPLFSPPVAVSAPLIVDKLSTEPDKQKLNIFKKISSTAKSKDDYGNTSKYNPPLDFSTPHKFDRPEFMDNLLHSAHSSGKKNKLPKPTITEEMPLNMSMSRQQVSSGGESMFSMEDLSLPRAQNFPKTPEMKRDSATKKKRKEKKEKKGKEIFPDMGNFLNKLQDGGDQSNFLSNSPELTQSLLMQAKMAGLASQNQNLLFPFPNLVFPPGPGLIPNQSMFQQFNSMQQQFQFGRPNTHEMGNMMNFPKYGQKERNEPMMYASTSGIPEKSFCNVASLIPPSLSIELVTKPPKEQPKSFSNVSSFSKHSEVVKKAEDIDTYDLTKDSSPEPNLPPPKVPTPTTIPAVVQPSLAPIEIALDDSSCKIKEKKEKKRDKKDKEGKVKKKKDKKDKIKNKDRKEGKEKSKKEKKEKRKDKDRASSVASAFDSQNDTDTCDNNSTSSSVPKLTLKLGANNSPRPNTPDSHKKFSVKSKKDEFSSPSSSITFDSLHMSNLDHPREREASPEMMKISALVTRPPKQKPPKKKEELSGESAELEEAIGKEGMSKPRATRPGDADGQVKHKNSAKKKPPTGNTADNIRDADGNEVWICPACGRVDDGTPMIGCDGCDAWYHWQCVGIFIPPDQTEDWYCRVCIGKKQKGELSDEKKKKRKKKDKKEH